MDWMNHLTNLIQTGLYFAVHIFKCYGKSETYGQERIPNYLAVVSTQYFTQQEEREGTKPEREHRNKKSVAL